MAGGPAAWGGTGRTRSSRYPGGGTRTARFARGIRTGRRRGGAGSVRHFTRQVARERETGSPGVPPAALVTRPRYVGPLARQGISRINGDCSGIICA
ncbi:hypothetical protein Shyhy01_69590 [Streptomyces hygroscopicus subsp. hygroscopicus]|nr:hypothetical protein Shyhy01_69590 [Streptomyces hygroscopicus subsp. hygroscopicus]